MDSAIAELIKRRRFQVLIHSCIYYRLAENIIDDFKFDGWSRELVKLQEQYPEESKEAPLYEEFKTFDGTTGFDLPIHESWVVNRAKKVLEVAKRFEGV